MKYTTEKIYQEFSELFDMADLVEEHTWVLLDKFNQREMKLFDFPAHQRIFLFILTRSIKTYASILHLCKEGYGQDVSNLLRTLLESLITVKYILHNKAKANEYAKRFVAYKWIVLRKQISDQEKTLSSMSAKAKEEFLKRKDTILAKVQEFKKDFRIRSDQALVTWSGRTVRDMAKFVDPKILEEYEATYRLCSRFSHPSILGDQEYLIRDDKYLTFSPLSSPIGIVPHLKSAIKYMLDFLGIVDTLYTLNFSQTLTDLRAKFEAIAKQEKYSQELISPEWTSASSSIRESIIAFDTNKKIFGNSAD